MKTIRMWSVGCVVACLLVTLAWTTGLAAVPLKVPVQGLLRDNAGVLVAEDVFAMTFALYASEDAAQPVWSETWPPEGVDCGELPQLCVHVKGGRFSVELGSHVPLTLAVVSGSPGLWLGVRVEQEPQLPRRPVGSSPYALHAGSAASLACSGCLNVDALTDAARATLQADAVQAMSVGLAPVTWSGDFGDLVGVPAGLDDGDDDTLAGLICDEGEVAKRLNDSWACGPSVTSQLPPTPPADCVPGTVGTMYFDVVLSTMRVCDGEAYRKIKFCSEECPLPATRACGTPLEDDCGDPCGGEATGLNVDQCPVPSDIVCGETGADECGNVCPQPGTGLDEEFCAGLLSHEVECGAPVVDDCLNECGSTGTLCAQSQQCFEGTCVSFESCKAILDAGLSSGDGGYSIQPPGGALLEVYCDMTTDGGGWTPVVTWSPSPSGNPEGFAAAFDSVQNHGGMTIQDLSDGVRWCDTDNSGDAVEYELEVVVPNSGELRWEFSYSGENLGGSGFWLEMIGPGGQQANALCNDYIASAGHSRNGLYGAEASVLPPDVGCTHNADMGDELLVGTASHTGVASLRLVFGHHNGSCGDYSHAQKLNLWVR